MRCYVLCPVAFAFTVLTAGKGAPIIWLGEWELSNYGWLYLVLCSSSINKFRTHFFHTIHTTTSTHSQKFSPSGPCAITQTVDKLSTVVSVVLHACPWFWGCFWRCCCRCLCCGWRCCYGALRDKHAVFVTMNVCLFAVLWQWQFHLPFVDD